MMILSPCGKLREEFWIGFPAINSAVFKVIVQYGLYEKLLNNNNNNSNNNNNNKAVVLI
jgi:hypothetical protein